jgi:tape measure domain-containing protein
MENDNVEMNIQVNSQVNNKGVDEAARGMANIATNAENAEKQVKELSSAITQAGSILSQLNKTIKPGMDLSEIEKALSSIEKRVDTAINNSINMYAQNVLKEISGQHKLRTGLFYDAQGLRNDRDRSVESHLNNMYSENAKQRYYQLSHLNRYTDWKENRRDTDSKWQQHLFNQSVQDRIEKGYKQKYTFDETSIKYAQKDLDLWGKRLNEEAGIALKRNLESSKKITDKMYQRGMSAKDYYYDTRSKERARQNYEEGEHLYRQNQWLVSQGKVPITEVKGEDGTVRSAEEVMKYYLFIQEEMKQRAELARQAKEAEQKATEAIEQKGTATEQAAQAATEEAKTAQESANKQKPMTEYQSKKIAVAEKQLSIEEQDLKLSERRLEERKRENDRKEADRNSPAAQFKNEHPELFALRGGQYHNKRYQAAGTLASIGGRLSSLGTGGKMIGDVLDTVGSFLRSPIAGTATAITKLVTGIIDLGEAAVKSFSEIESIKTQLGVVFSNQTQADAMFGEISQYAVHSPFGVQQTSELAVLLKQSGVYASDLMNTLKMLGDTAGGNMEKMKRIANNYAQIVSIGKASMLDMRQFAYAGIPIFEAVSKELGVSQKELRKMISDGKVTSDIIAKVFKDLTGINGIFEKATEKGAKTLKARLQNLQDAKQLALAEAGDAFVNAGTVYGGDSPYLKLLSVTESFYQWAREKLDISNIQRDVSAIARNKTKIEELQAVYDYAKQTGDKNLEKLAKAQLEAQQNLWGYDKTRNVLSSSYDVKNKNRLEYAEKYGELTESGVQDLIDYYRTIISGDRYLPLNESVNGSLLSPDITQAQREALQKEVEMYNTILQELELYRLEIMKARKATTEDEIKADRERNLQKEQQEAFDRANSISDSSTSLLSKFQELNELYKASDEYKQKKEEENKKTLEEALGYLKQIAVHTDELGNLDTSKMNAKEFNDWIERGAFAAVKKLQVVNGDRRYSQEERERLVKQYGGYQTELENYLTKTMGSSFDKFIYDNFKLNNLGTKSRYSDEEFYDLFSELYYNNEDQIKKAKDQYAEQQRATANRIQNGAARQSALAKAEERIEAFNAQMDEFSEALRNSTNGYQTQIDAKNADKSILGTGGNEFIALWKRIFASNTGLSTQGMVTPRRTLDMYLEGVAPRRVVSEVMKATLDTLGVDAATNLLKPSDKQMELLGTKGSGRFINQIDWKKSADGLKEFALRLSASTDVVEAYTQGLEQEYEALSNLIVQGATEFESQDLEKQKLVTVKQLQKLSEAGMSEAASQLVNALGNKLMTTGGSNVTFKDGKFYDEKGLEVSEEQLKVSDDIFEYLKQLLPDIKQQIAESKLSGENNRLLSEQFKKVLPSMLTGMMMGGNYLQRGVDRILLDNPEYAVNQAYNAYDVVTGRYKNENGSYREGFEWLSNTNVEDLFRAGIDTGADNYEEANRLLEELISVVRTSAASLADPGSGYGNLQNFERSQEMREAARVAYRNAMGFKTEENYSATGWADKGGQSLGNKIVKDLLGVDVGYTKEQLFDAFKEDAGLDMSTQLDKTIEKQLLFKVAIEETKDAMQNLGDETANLVGTLGKKAFTIPFEKLGESAMNYWSQALSYEEASEKCAEDQKQAYRELGAEALNTLGPIMQKAGFEMVARGAINDSWGMILGGLGLAAAGGFASGLGNALSANNDKDKDEAAKIQDLKDQLADLLEQARKDALYYENNLRHKTALGINKEFSYQSVNDAVITPDGDVITTDPKDYLIATKTPGQFAGGGTVTPIINCNVINNSSSKVRQEQQQNPDGSIDIITIIEDTVGNYIASSKSDDAFSARNSRIRGRQSIMS